MPRSIYLTMVSDIALTPDDLWPEGAPEDFTEADVRAVIDEHGIEEVMSWFMFVTNDVDIYVAPEKKPQFSTQGLKRIK